MLEFRANWDHDSDSCRHRIIVADIFISYKREDQSKAKTLADALIAKGWSVWWDPKLRAGEHFDDAIEEAVKAAKCVIVLWTELSVESRYVKNEATRALKLKKLIPVALDAADPPLVFENLHTIQMQEWHGAKDSAGFRSLVEQLQSKIGGGTSAAAASASFSSKSPEPTSFDPLFELKRIRSDSIAEFRSKRRQEAGKLVSPEEVGSDERTLLNLHVELERAVDSYRASTLKSLGLSDRRDLFAPPGFNIFGCPYGILTHLDLQDQSDFRAKQLLRRLDGLGGGAIDYTPEQLKDLPENLQNRGFYLLVSGSQPDLSFQPLLGHLEEPGSLRITQETFGRYSLLAKQKSIFREFSYGEISEMEELAARLGLHFKGS
jgi:hypothetical protein